MRVVCWNICGGTDKKWDLLAGLGPDVAVLSEVARQPKRLTASLFEEPPSWQWVGLNPAKGLAVATFAGPACGVLAPASSGRWSVAARQGALTVLGIWSCPSEGNYGREVIRALDAHTRWLDPAANVIVAGDFNIDGAGALRRRTSVFTQVIDRLAGLGLTSAYHAVRQESFGGETAPTYYHHRQPVQPFHIDFCFLSKPLLDRLRSVEVGSFADWVAPGFSDHVPLVVELQ